MFERVCVCVCVCTADDFLRRQILGNGAESICGAETIVAEVSSSVSRRSLHYYFYCFLLSSRPRRSVFCLCSCLRIRRTWSSHSPLAPFGSRVGWMRWKKCFARLEEAEKRDPEHRTSADSLKNYDGIFHLSAALLGDRWTRLEECFIINVRRCMCVCLCGRVSGSRASARAEMSTGSGRGDGRPTQKGKKKARKL